VGLRPSACRGFRATERGWSERSEVLRLLREIRRRYPAGASPAQQAAPGSWQRVLAAEVCRCVGPRVSEPPTFSPESRQFPGAQGVKLPEGNSAQRRTNTKAKKRRNWRGLRRRRVHAEGNPATREARSSPTFPAQRRAGDPPPRTMRIRTTRAFHGKVVRWVGRPGEEHPSGGRGSQGVGGTNSS
jgi:hypothetical protein